MQGKVESLPFPDILLFLEQSLPSPVISFPSLVLLKSRDAMENVTCHVNVHFLVLLT